MRQSARIEEADEYVNRRIVRSCGQSDIAFNTHLLQGARMKTAILALGLAALAAPLAAQTAAPSPVGFWNTISDEDGKPRALVEIREVDGRFVGVIKALLAPGEDPEKVCEKCPGERKGRKIVGMEILRGLKAEGSEWGRGEILDPKNGKTYRASMKLEDGGKRLVVRGFVGFSLLGRSQTWIRTDGGNADGGKPAPRTSE
jgi:uncharacterized protein (DUF2147 family)